MAAVTPMRDKERNLPLSESERHTTSERRKTEQLYRQWSAFQQSHSARTLSSLIQLAVELQQSAQASSQPRQYAFASALLDAFYHLSDSQPPDQEDILNIGNLIDALNQNHGEPLSTDSELDDFAELEHVIEPRRRRLVYILSGDTEWCSQVRPLLESHGFLVEVFDHYDKVTAQQAHDHPMAIVSELPVPGAGERQPEVLWDDFRQGRLRIPVMLVSEQDSFNTRLAAVRSGAIRFFSRPLEASALLTALQQLTGTQPTEPFRVLLVDDDPMLIELYSAVLIHEGYQVACASHPREAMELLQASDPDLILLDLYLPTCSGIDLAHMIRQYPRFETTPIIFLSVETNLDLQLACARLSGEEFLNKPVAPWRLLMAIETRAQRSRLINREHLMLTERMVFQSEHDALTGLPNRLLFMDRLEQALVHARRQARHVAVMMLDVDYFQRINDVYGHNTGDELLLTLARELPGALGPGDTLSRPGGDEFLVLMPNLSSLETSAQTASRLLQAIPAQIDVSGAPLKLSCSMGIAISPHDGTSAEELLKHADTALYHAKRNARGNMAFFTPAMGAAISDQLQLEQDLEKALQEQQFYLVYQPIVALHKHRVDGAEALIRWQHPQQGMISPLDFIPAAERWGLIGQIGRWVLETACRQLALWHQAGLRHLTMAVNLSAPQLLDPSLVQWLKQCLVRHRIPKGHLILELTESMLMEEPDQAIQQLSQFRQLGARIAIDDFGTGYSSLSYMKHLPLDKLKIDKSFLDNLERPEDSQIVSAIISLAHNLNLEVVGEGVETPKQLAHLSHLGCDYYQGYLFSRPVDANQFERLTRTPPPQLGASPNATGESDGKQKSGRGGNHGRD